MPEAALMKRSMTGSAAAAVLLMLFEEDEAAQILSRLEPEEVRQLGNAMYDVADVAVEEVDAALDQFVSKAKSRTTVGYGAEEHIRAMMHKALGPDRADNMLARITPPQRSNKLEMLKWMEPKEIAQAIENEHPQIMALVLAHLDAPAAADVLQLLPLDMQDDIVYRIATLGPVTAEALDDLEALLMRRGTKTATSTASQRGGTTEAAAIMNNVRKVNEQRIIKQIGKRDKAIAQTIEEEMFVFDNLIEMDDKNLGALLRTVDNAVLVVALKGCNELLKAKIFGCMSSRAAQAVQDEIEDRGPIRLADVIDAQKQIIAAARRMAESGAIRLGSKGGEDFV